MGEIPGMDCFLSDVPAEKSWQAFPVVASFQILRVVPVAVVFLVVAILLVVPVVRVAFPFRDVAVVAVVTVVTELRVVSQKTVMRRRRRIVKRGTSSRNSTHSTIDRTRKIVTTRTTVKVSQIKFTRPRRGCHGWVRMAQAI